VLTVRMLLVSLSISHPGLGAAAMRLPFGITMDCANRTVNRNPASWRDLQGLHEERSKTFGM
jgi:hypothetical protein